MDNLTGFVSGNLTVVGFSHKSSYRSRYFWNCKCKCGNDCVVRGDLLKSYHTKSCGCLNREIKWIKKPYGEAAFNAMYGNYKHSAKLRKIEFSLSKEEFKLISENDCYFCGSKPKPMGYDRSGTGDYVGNGIDRLNNNIGYLKANCVPCCNICNRAKQTLSESEFMNWISQLVKFRAPWKDCE